MHRCLFLLVILFPLAVFGQGFTADQEKVLKIAKEIGEEIGWPETIQAIALQESSAGVPGYRIGDLDEPVGKRSYGVMHVKVATSRFVLNNFPRIKDQYFGNKRIRQIIDEELIVLLMSNDEFCIEIAALNFLKMLEFSGGDWIRAVAGYNGGWGIAKRLKKPREFDYVKHINRRIKKQIRPFNASLILAENES